MLAVWVKLFPASLQRRREYFEASLMKMGMELEATPSVSLLRFPYCRFLVAAVTIDPPPPSSRRSSTIS